jgi:hypothetical protein
VCSGVVLVLLFLVMQVVIFVAVSVRGSSMPSSVTPPLAILERVKTPKKDTIPSVNIATNSPLHPLRPEKQSLTVKTTDTSSSVKKTSSFVRLQNGCLPVIPGKRFDVIVCAVKGESLSFWLNGLSFAARVIVYARAGPVGVAGM